MAGLKQIKNKIRSVNKTRKVTKAMEAVSAVKMRKSQERALLGRPYARAALSILQKVSGVQDLRTHALLLPRTIVEKAAIVVIASDKGLAGALNASVFKATYALMERESLTKTNTTIIAIGKKAQEHFSKRDFTLVHGATMLDEADMEVAPSLAGTLSLAYEKGEFDRVFVVYTNFHSTFEQDAIARQLLPISFDTVKEIVDGIVPEKGKFAQVSNDTSAPDVYTVEPSPEAVFSTVLPLLLSIELYHALVEAFASEHSARMVAMKNASDKAGEMSKSLTLVFNKERQAAITAEISEIVGGMETSS